VSCHSVHLHPQWQQPHSTTYLLSPAPCTHTQVNIAVDTVNGVRGAFAAKDIQEGDLLLVIPDNLTWTLELGGADNPAVSGATSSNRPSDSSSTSSDSRRSTRR
jgi:hypothetical protein